jgi:hypothetical protein
MMKFPNTYLLVVSHGLALGIGLLVAWLSDDEAHQDQTVEHSPRSAVSSHTQKTRSAEISAASSERPLASWRSAEYQQAWIAVRTAELSTTERIQAQRSLLASWAEVNLAAALEAALAETWDNDREISFNNCGVLLDVFGSSFANQPGEAWELIKSGRYGVGSGMLRQIWLESAGREDPLLVAGMLREISWRDRPRAMSAIRSGMNQDSKLRDTILAEMAKHPKEIVPTDQLLSFLPLSKIYNKGQDLREATADLPPRIAEAMALQFGNRLFDSDNFLEEVSLLPENMRIAAVAGAMKQIDAGESSRFTEILDLMVDAQAWTELEQFNLPARLKESAAQGDSALIADWVTKLPARPELTESIHRGVEKYLRDHPEESRTWIAEIEQPLWRDRVYSEYSQQSLQSKKDREASRWALDQIQDATFKKEAERWRANWEKRQ